MFLLIIIVVVIFVCVLFKYYVLEKLTIKNLESKHVFITGCDSGFGHLLALKLVQNGISTFAGCYTEKGKTELEKKAKNAKGKLWTLPLDVTNNVSVIKASQFVRERLDGKGLWGLVCNAGIASDNSPDDWCNLEDYQKLMDVNAYGVIRTCHAFKRLVKQAQGRIVIVTSIVGRLVLPAVGPYCMSKFAAEAYADLLRVELKGFGVSVHILEPGFFKTAITNPDLIIKCFQQKWERLDKETQEEYSEDFYETGKRVIPETISAFNNENLFLVVDAYYHALTSKFPRSRYHVGNDSKYFFIPLSLLPTFIQDFVIYCIIVFSKAPIPKAVLKLRGR